MEEPKKDKPKPTKADQEAGKIYAGILAKGDYDFLNKGEAVLLHNKDIVFKFKTPFRGFIVARGMGGMLCMGSVTVIPKQKVTNTEWIMTIKGGSTVYGADGNLYSTTKTADMRVLSAK